MSLAAETRAAVRARPCLLAGLQAGIVNYAAAARTLDLSADTDAVATALRRFAASLPDRTRTPYEVRVTMQGGLSFGGDDPLFVVGEITVSETPEGSKTAILAHGEVDPTALSHVLGVLAAEGVAIQAAAVTKETLFVLVDRRDGPAALRRVESALDAVPTKTTV